MCLLMSTTLEWNWEVLIQNRYLALLTLSLKSEICWKLLLFCCLRLNGTLIAMLIFILINAHYILYILIPSFSIVVTILWQLHMYYSQRFSVNRINRWDVGRKNYSLISNPLSSICLSFTSEQKYRMLMYWFFLVIMGCRIHNYFTK